jgi:hypothetical protein
MPGAQSPLQVEQDLTPDVMRLFRLVHLDSYLWDLAQGTCRAAAR